MASKVYLSARSRDFWNYLEENSREIADWPSWMKGSLGSREKADSTKSQDNESVRGEQNSGQGSE